MSVQSINFKVSSNENVVGYRATEIRQLINFESMLVSSEEAFHEQFFDTYIIFFQILIFGTN